MKVWILSADTITDLEGEVLDAGGVLGIYSTHAAADRDLKATVGTSYWHKEYDYTIEEYEVKG